MSGKYFYTKNDSQHIFTGPIVVRPDFYDGDQLISHRQELQQIENGLFSDVEIDGALFSTEGGWPMYEFVGGDLASNIVPRVCLASMRDYYYGLLSIDSFNHIIQKYPQYKQINAALDIYDAATKSAIQAEINNHRNEYGRVWALIDAATDAQGIRDAYAQRNYTFIPDP